MIHICLEAGVNFFDTSNIYSFGGSEQVLGAALKGRRDKAIISTKATLPTGEGPNDSGASRYHLVRAVEASLKRLSTDHIDVYFMMGADCASIHWLKFLSSIWKLREIAPKKWQLVSVSGVAML